MSVDVIKIFFFVTDGEGQNKLECLALSNLHLRVIMLIYYYLCCPAVESLLDLLANIGLARKKLDSSNALAYFVRTVIDKEGKKINVTLAQNRY